MTPDIEIREILTNTLAAHLPHREIVLLGDAITFIVARALDTALFDAAKHSEISAEVQWLQAQWRRATDDWRAADQIIQELRRQLDGAA
jgi:hypothetical protein